MASFCDIVADACPRSDVHRTLVFAREMAKSFSARLSVVSYAWPRIFLKDVLNSNPFRAQEQTALMERALAASRSAFDKVFVDTRDEVDWCSGIAEPTMGMHARLLAADLLITDSSEEEAYVLPNPAHVALDSGIPVLRLGRQLASSDFPSVLVAWKDSSHARRAVHDALPILVHAKRVSVVGVGDEVSADQLDAVATHLRRHKVKACHWHIPDTAGDVCSELLAQAQREAAKLIVTGVYSRGPMIERVLGGVTANMLKYADISWFMAH